MVHQTEKNRPNDSELLLLLSTLMSSNSSSTFSAHEQIKNPPHYRNDEEGIVKWKERKSREGKKGEEEEKREEEGNGVASSSLNSFVRTLLRRSAIRDEYLQIFFNPAYRCMEVYQHVFTHSSVHPFQNYEYFEILGDSTCNKSIVWYIQDRFPFLRNSDGVKVIARLRINLVSKKYFSTLASQLGFLPFISCGKEILEQREKSLLEDVFEAFFGATELLFDRIFGLGVGYFICFRILKSILDEKEISLRYEDLFDPITRLKETFDYFRAPRQICPYIWGSMAWETSKISNGHHVVSLFQIDKVARRKELLSTACAPYLDEAKQGAATCFLQFLQKKGFYRPVHEYYHQILSYSQKKDE